MGQKFFTILLLSAVILTVLSGCFKKEIKPQINNNIQKPPLATTSEIQKEKATTTEVADINSWRIYENKESKFEFLFKYPNNWECKEINKNSVDKGRMVDCILNYENKGVFPEIRIYISSELASLTPGEYLKQKYGDYILGVKIPSDFNYLVGDNKALRVSYKESDLGGKPPYNEGLTIVFNKNNKLFDIIAHIDDKGEQKNIIEKILKSIEVKTTAEDVDTNNWKIYRNNDYGYLMKYPLNWNVSEVDYYSKDLDTRVKYISFSNKEYALFFLLSRPEENFSSGRTGVGAGDFKYRKTWKIENINIDVKDLIYENRIREIFFSGKNDNYIISGYFSNIGDAYRDNFIFDNSQLFTAEKIIESFKFIK